MGFPSLADVLSYYNTLKTNLAEEEARLSHSDSALFLRTKKRYVGGSN